MSVSNKIRNLKNIAFVVVDDNACSYDPDFSSPTKIIPPYGSEVEIIEERHDWVRLRWCGKEAWSVRSHIDNQLTAKKENLHRDRVPSVFNDSMRRKREAKELRRRFNVGYVESEHYQRVMALLRQIANSQRLKANDVTWLMTEADYCWTEELQKAWHTLEATALSKAWERGGNAWDAVNASAHWRKADEPGRALGVTTAALAQVGRGPKLRSALLTTRGGALRDLRRLDEAKSLGCEAHELTPKDYRPCTLLGAVHLELGDLVAGHEWYAKAESLGAPPKAIDQDLRMLLARSPKQEQQRIREFLLRENPERFNWLNRWHGSQRPRALL